MVDLRQPSLYAYFDVEARPLRRHVRRGQPRSSSMRAEGPCRAQRRPSRWRPRPGSGAARVLDRRRRALRPDVPAARSPASSRRPSRTRSRSSSTRSARQKLAAAGITEQSDIDLFTTLIAGLADQQVANDPGGDRWSGLTDRIVAMFFTEIDANRTDSTGKACPMTMTTTRDVATIARIGHDEAMRHRGDREREVRVAAAQHRCRRLVEAHRLRAVGRAGDGCPRRRLGRRAGLATRVRPPEAQGQARHGRDRRPVLVGRHERGPGARARATSPPTSSSPSGRPRPRKPSGHARSCPG